MYNVLSMEIIKHKEPNLLRPKFMCDGMLHEKLNDIALLSNMNKHNFTLFLGKPGSGKSTQAVAFLKTRECFKKVYHDIILFCPPNSRASIKENFWGKNIPEDLIFDDLNTETFQECYDLAMGNANEKNNTLIVIDDMQRYLKDKELQKLLLHAVNNRRHARLSIWLLCQTYKSIPIQIRQGLTDLFIFKVNKNEMEHIFEEQVELNPKQFQQVLNISFKKDHDFIYLNSNLQKIFINWDELKFTS